MGTSKTRTLRAEEQQQKRDEKGDKNDDGRCTRTKASDYCARRRAARKKMARGTGHSPIRVSASRPNLSAFVKAFLPLFPSIPPRSPTREARSIGRDAETRIGECPVPRAIFFRAVRLR